MTINNICEILSYDKEKFNLYLDYRNICDNSIYLSFEEFLLCENNLDEYLLDEDRILKKYYDYHKDEKIHDYDNYELFCESMHIFPFNKDKLKNYRNCDNCIYYRHTKNLITDEEYDACVFEDIDNYYDCDYHEYDVSKAKAIVRTLSR